jgi:glutathione S-transferase
VKKMLELKKVGAIFVPQYANQANEELVDWIGIRNAPAIVQDDQRAVTRWLDQIACVEKLAAAPALLPSDPWERAITIGLCNEFAGEWGYGWCRRLMLFADTFAVAPPEFREAPPIQEMIREYGVTEAGIAAAPERCVAILEMLTSRLNDQRAHGSDFLVGSTMTAADIYWATFSTMLKPLDDDLCPMSEELRRSRTVRDSRILAATHPVLLEHRDMMFRRFLGPLEF